MCSLRVSRIDYNYCTSKLFPQWPVSRSSCALLKLNFLTNAIHLLYALVRKSSFSKAQDFVKPAPGHEFRHGICFAGPRVYMLERLSCLHAQATNFATGLGCTCLRACHVYIFCSGHKFRHLIFFAIPRPRVYMLAHLSAFRYITHSLITPNLVHATTSK